MQGHSGRSLANTPFEKSILTFKNYLHVISFLAPALYSPTHPSRSPWEVASRDVGSWETVKRMENECIDSALEMNSNMAPWHIHRLVSCLPGWVSHGLYARDHGFRPPADGLTSIDFFHTKLCHCWSSWPLCGHRFQCPGGLCRCAAGHSAAPNASMIRQPGPATTWAATLEGELAFPKSFNFKGNWKSINF